MKRMSYGKKLFGELKTLKWQNFMMLIVSGTINAIGVTLFLSPSGLIDSGLSGTSIMLSRLTPVTLSIWLVILNFPFYILGLKRQGLNFTIYSLFAIGIYSFVSYLIQYAFGIDFSAGSPIVQGDILLCAIFGGLLSGIGSGTTIRYGGALDGVEVMGVLFSKFLGITIGTFVMSYNVILYVLAGILSEDWILPLYSILTYAVGIKAVDFIVEGLDKGKAAMIITAKHDEVARGLNETLGRGITLIPAQGFYSGESRTIVYCVVNRFQIGRVKKIVTAVDPTAFVTITEISDVLGTSLKAARRKKTPKPQIKAVKKSIETNGGVEIIAQEPRLSPLSDTHIADNTEENDQAE